VGGVVGCRADGSSVDSEDAVEASTGDGAGSAGDGVGSGRTGSSIVAADYQT
jgi:hypothetical protein